jgi:hypothetical protein
VKPGIPGVLGFDVSLPGVAGEPGLRCAKTGNPIITAIAVIIIGLFM